jgi:hypothetical protein
LEQWTVVMVGATDAGIDYHDSNHFAIDSLGRPRYIYADELKTHRGTFYAFCDEQCTEPQNWYEIFLTTALLRRAELELTASGHPRFAFEERSISDIYRYYLGYLECNSACTSGNTGTWLGFSFGLYSEQALWQPNFSLALDGSDRARLAFYVTEVSDPSPFTSHTLYYAVCNSDCGISGSWQWVPLGLAEAEGMAPDLQFDAGSKPHLSYITKGEQGNVSYAWCTAKCESNIPTWQSMVVESQAALDQNEPVPPPPHCTPSPSMSYWTIDSPSLALTVTGKAWIGYATPHLISGGDCGNLQYDLTRVRLALLE